MVNRNGPVKTKVGRGTFTISLETTFVTQPLDADGYPDYVTALNERLRDGVTPDNNACVPMWRVLGASSEGANPPDAFFRMLGIDRPSEDRLRYVSQSDFAKERLGIDPQSPEMAEIYNQSEPIRKRPWTRNEYPHLADWLQANEEPLAAMIETGNCQRFYAPILPLNPEKGLTTAVAGSVFSIMQNSRAVAAAFASRAMLNVGEGKLEEAWRDILAAFRLGRFVSQGGTLIALLVSYALEMLAARTGVALLEFAKATSEQLARWAEELRQMPPRSSVADAVDLGDRIFMLESILLVDRHGIRVLHDESQPAPTFFQTPNPFVKIEDAGLNGINWDPALRSVNLWFDRLVSGLRIPDRAQRQEVFAEFDRELKQMKNDLDAKKDSAGFASLSPDAKGRFLVDGLVTLATPSVMLVQQSADRAEQHLTNLDLAFALARFHADNGAYPNQLSEIAPKYLASIPKDIFSGRPPIYKPVGYLLYSVGPNGQDDRGHTNWDDPPGDDIAVRMPSS